MSSKFYKCVFFSYYIGKGIRWFKVLGIKLAFKHVKDYEFKADNPKGMFIGWWLITLNEKK